MKITQIQSGRYRKNYASVFIDGEYAFRLHKDLLFDLKINEGKNLTESELLTIKNEGERKEAIEYAYLFLTYRPRSEKEIKDRLRRKGYSTETIQITIETLKTKNFINDHEFAKIFTEPKLKGKGLWGDLRIEQELILKGVEKSTIKEIIHQLKEETKDPLPSEDERAYQALVKKASQNKNTDSHTLQRRLYDYLMRRGFSYDSIEQALKRYKNQKDKNR